MSRQRNSLRDESSVEMEAALERREADRRRREIRSLVLWQILGLGSFLAIWQVASGTVVDSFFVSKPTAVLLRLWELLRTGDFAYHLGYTLFNTLAGYLIGSILGIASATAVTFFPFMAEIIEPFVTALYAVPVVAYAPLLVVWFGIGLLPKILLAALFVFFIVFINTLAGMQETSQHIRQQLLLFGANPIQIARHVTLPSALPFMVSALRITLPQAMMGAVVGEFISSNRGIGWFINQSSSNYDTAGVMAGVLVLGGAVMLMNVTLNLLQRKYAKWGRGHDAAVGSVL